MDRDKGRKIMLALFSSRQDIEKSTKKKLELNGRTPKAEGTVYVPRTRVEQERAIASQAAARFGDLFVGLATAKLRHALGSKGTDNQGLWVDPKVVEKAAVLEQLLARKDVSEVEFIAMKKLFKVLTGHGAGEQYFIQATSAVNATEAQRTLQTSPITTVREYAVVQNLRHNQAPKVQTFQFSGVEVGQLISEGINVRTNSRYGFAMFVGSPVDQQILRNHLINRRKANG